jgi:hypothetical protein
MTLRVAPHEHVTRSLHRLAACLGAQALDNQIAAVQMSWSETGMAIPCLRARARIENHRPQIWGRYCRMSDCFAQLAAALRTAGSRLAPGRTLM